MNELNFDLNQMFLSLGAGPSLVGGAMPSLTGTGEQPFLDLLSLVETNELVDADKGLVEEEIGQGLSELFDANATQRAESAVLLNFGLEHLASRESQVQPGAEAIAKTIVGPVPQGRGMMESQMMPVTQAGSDLLMQQIPKAEPVSADTEKSLVKSEAVAAWSSALLAGDVKSVKVEERPKSGLEVLKNFEINGSSTNEVGTKEAGAKDFQKTLVDPKVENPTSKLSSLAEVLSQEKAGKSLAQQELAVSREVQPTAIILSSQEEKANTDSGSSDAKQSFTGSDFVLAAIQDVKSSSETSTSAVADVSKLDVETVDMLGTKIAEAKDIGNGQLRVELSNKELGGIDIVVVEKSGVVEVRLEADRPETRVALEASKVDLQKLLEGSSNQIARLEITASAPGSHGNHASISRDALESVVATDAFLSTRKESGANTDLGLVVERESETFQRFEPKTLQEMTQSQDRQNERFKERRDEAMERWREQLEKGAA